jgi:hypothetical protein
MYMHVLAVPATTGYYALDSRTGDVILPFDDMGTPFLNKEFNRLYLRGANTDALHTVDVYYRLNNAAWTAYLANATVSGDGEWAISTGATSIVAKKIQLRVHFDDNALDIPTEINEIAIRFREKPADTVRRYGMMLELSTHGTDTNGNVLPSPDVQLTALEALHGTRVALVDPLGRASYVTVDSVSQSEYLQEAEEEAVMIVQVTATEV